MKPNRALRVLVAVALGAVVTFASSWAAQMAWNRGASVASQVLFWPNTLMQLAVPLNNIGTTEKPFYEATPLSLIAYFLSYVVGVLVYSMCIYAVMFGRGGAGRRGRGGDEV